MWTAAVTERHIDRENFKSGRERGRREPRRTETGRGRQRIEI